MIKALSITWPVSRNQYFELDEWVTKLSFSKTSKIQFIYLIYFKCAMFQDFHLCIKQIVKVIPILPYESKYTDIKV